jgi:hypothetical protein
VVVALAGCSHAAPRADRPLPAAPGWWDIDNSDGAGLLGGAALRLGTEPAYLVMPEIPAYEPCHASVVGSRVTVTGVGQDAAGELAGDELAFDGGFRGHRASPERAAQLDGIVAAVKAKCDRARTCYRAAMPVLGIENREATELGPLLRADACDNIITNLAGDIQSAGKTVPADCAAPPG